MPKIKVNFVVSFSSEDPVHVANNLLLDEPKKKWKCKNKGETSATVILQLDQASKITGIDVGNEHSAYIEILVGRSACPDDFKVLLILTSFMTPAESRNSRNINAVKMLTTKDFQAPTCEEKWDRIKVICTQPFNKNVQYGLAFLRLETKDDKPSSTTPFLQLQTDNLKKLFPDELKPGSLFSKWKEEKNEPVSIASAIRNSSSPNLTKNKIVLNPPSTSSRADNDAGVSTPLRRDRNELFYSQDEEGPNKKIDRLFENARKEKEQQQKDVEDKNKKVEDKEIKKKDKKDEKEKKRDSIKRKLDAGPSSQSPQKKPKPSHPTKPFSQLLSGVVLVISGIQNPDRANLRAKALEMGAKYKPDWDNTCTHLICAFVNTPKFKQVKGKGKIVTKKWIEECHSKRKRLPWRRFCLDFNEQKLPESEDEIWEEKQQEQTSRSRASSTDDETGDYDDSEMQKKALEFLAAKQADREKKSSDSSDTEKENNTQNVYSVDTDDEVEKNGVNNNESSYVKLPEFFDAKLFYIDSELSVNIEKEVKKYIIAYKGQIVESPDKDTNYFIFEDETVEFFKEMYPNGTFVKPDWIWECHNQKQVVPCDEYLI